MIAVITCGKKRVRVTRELNHGELTKEYFHNLPPAWYSIVLIKEIPTEKKFTDNNDSFYVFWNGTDVTLERGKNES